MLLNLIVAIAASASLSSAMAPATQTPMKVAEGGACTLTVVLQCAVAQDGAASDCRIISEDPNTLSAGEAALAMSRSFHLSAREDGAPVLLPVRIQTGQCRTGQ
jgi:hypothetical protein